MIRGDVVPVADRGGNYTGKPRPAVVVQSNAFASRDSVTVCPMTTTRADAPLLRISVQPSDGLPLTQESWIQVDKITTVRRDRVGAAPIGRLAAEDLARLNASLTVFLGIG